MEKNKEVYRLQLGLLAEVMPLAVERLLDICGSAERICALEERELEEYLFLTQKEKEELKNAKKRGLPYILLEQMKKKGIRTVCLEEEHYPEKLRRLEDRPYMLFYRGELPEEDTKHVAVIGARKCSDYGRRAAEFFGKELAAAGIPVVSGMAVGVDGLAQAACIKAGGKSYGILGSGVDVIYPHSNRELYRELQKNGGVISEYPPGREALAFHFPRRNRLISAFCDLLLVVEAREKSGTYITVQYALEQGREVYAVPGRIEEPLSMGCNSLIAQGAGIASSIEEVLFALRGENREARRLRTKTDSISERAVKEGRKIEEDDEAWQGELRKKIREILRITPATAQDLYAALGETDRKIQELLSELMQLEIEGLLLCRGGVYEIK